MYYITSHGEFSMQDASIKPRVDIAKILMKKHGFKEVGVPLFGKFSKQQIDIIIQNNFSHFTSDDVIFWQYPIFITNPSYFEEQAIKAIHKQHARVVAIIHDIDYLRGWQDTPPEALKLFDGIIDTSKKMTKVLRSWGIMTPIIEMGPFAFLTNVNKPTYYGRNVYYCGSTYTWKTSFLDSTEFSLYVYGTLGKDVKLGKNAKYLGAKETENLVASLQEGFGFIWDDEINEGSGLEEYLAYNYPYKLSLYIASNMPVICKSGTNVGNYVKEHGIGFTVKDIKEVPNKLKEITVSDYRGYLEGIQEVRPNIVSGNYVWEAITKYIKLSKIEIPYDVTSSDIGLIIAK